MNRGEQFASATVEAAREGDQVALDNLIAQCLPLVYNVVGRALDGHVDVDDVVQETMLRVVRGLDGLRDPASFRSWLVAIAIQQVRDRWRARQAQPVFPLPENEADTADPGADFVDLAILRLGLSGQRLEVVEATRWLDPDDRDVLSLWWLEAAGELTRAELAAGCGLPPQHAAVRVQRMKSRLDAARSVVRALARVPRCEALAELISPWSGLPSALWRKRIARHTRECPLCARQWDGMVPAEGLLVGLGLVPLPAGYMVAGLLTAHAGGGGTGAHAAAKGLTKGVAKSTWAGKTVAAVLCAAVAAGGAVALAYAMPGSHSADKPAARSGSATVSIPLTSAPSVTSASPSPRPTRSPGGTKVPMKPGNGRGTETATKSTGPVYGQTVDTVDTAPALDVRPLPLPKRPELTPLTGTGKYSHPFKGSLGGKYLMFWQGDYITITGKGYFSVRYEIAWFNRAGLMQMPTWTGLKGKLFHVASGGGHRMTDTHPGQPATYTWMGNPEDGHITLPAGAQHMWQNEYFYLDGTVTLHENETGPADYNLSVTPFTWTQVSEEINTTPGTGTDIVRYGLVRDTGTDAAPVPQYLTRSTPADPMSVAQHSRVRTVS